MDEYMTSPVFGHVGPLLDELSGHKERQVGQIFVPRWNFGSGGHTEPPYDFLGRAYDRAEAWPSVWKPLLYAPLLEDPQVRALIGGNPHNFFEDYPDEVNH